jgi:ribosomal-protein-alanine N-acetyltransferase
MRPAVRPAQPADLEAVVALDQVCFGPASWSASTWAGEFARDDRVLLVADEGGVVGYVVLIVPPDPRDPVDLTRIAVTPAERRTGIGSQLATAALGAVRDRNVLLEVAESNEHARRLYRGQGFREISRRRGYYQRPSGSEDAVIMQRQALRVGGKV